MDQDASNEFNDFGPDCFSFSKCEVVELLSEDEDFLPPSLQISVSAEKSNGNKTKGNCTSSSSLFSNCIGPDVSEMKMQKLKSLLRQSVFALSHEVDEMVDPVFKMCWLKSVLRFRESLLCSSHAASDIDEGSPSKKFKPSTLSSSASESQDMGVSALRGEISNDVLKRCTQCHTETPQWRSTPEVTKPLCNGCRLKCNEGKEPLLVNENNKDSLLDTNVGAAKEYQDVDEDLQILLESDRSMVEEAYKKKSDEISAMLGHMEQKLEELLDIVMSKCRTMTLPERQQLHRMIKKLPPMNLDSVVDIIRHHSPSSNENSCNEIHIDLEKLDNITLWRLYFYVEAVENAKKLCDAR